MEMERINDDTIRVTIGPDDLTERGITFLDLLGNHKEIEDFFYSILEEVDKDHQFTNNEAVTFQVLPNNNGMELYISKNPAESIDAIIKADNKKETSNVELDKVSDFLKHKLAEPDAQGEVDNMGDDPADLDSYTEDKQIESFILKLPDFESLPKIAAVFSNNGIESILYKYNGVYYLEITFYMHNEGLSNDAVQNEMALAYEYADPANVSKDFLLEHGKVIIEAAAFETARHFFN
ncbi:adaptor protein MecA [Pediococcus claussenii]|uniref:Adapter protein MecA n=1 Tax=Pediococcus claussenii (strain ATCC BAA-344 / DSM 14800 / JCM 18046 / KCTC 3811 / LMG 21948 / P06) TaxID=701521 RepID=G8PCS2_PEDCP|nr:adaptor protein MecA [Pediococcus claussenii]AEV95057.1 negative regulator of genetic competence family protein [Pediococcus claussenii ATCC BAA-344]KRN18918.1 hypothetical protein IV79_GL001761 [Pediococcus claussenii]